MEHNSHPIKCKHELEYCEQCNVVFCKKCKEEWKKEVSWQTTTTTWPSNCTYTGCTIDLLSHIHN